MKILMLCYEYPPIGGGGAKVVHGLSSSLVRQGHQVDIVTMNYKNLPRLERFNNLNIYRVKCLRFKPDICTPFEMLTYIVFALPLILKLCRKNNYDINHTHFIFPDGILAYLVNKINSLPFVVTAHGSDVPGYNPDRFKLLHKFLVPLWRIVASSSANLIMPSESLDNLAKKITPGLKTTLIPNGINLNKFSVQEKKENKILLVTRMFERKGVQYFIQALSGMSHDYVINIVGDGPYLGNIKKLAKDLNLNINFLGFLDNNSAELKELYESSRIFVFTSEAENFPVVLLEAMISGLAIITTNDSGCAEVVGSEAILVSSKDPSEIRNALTRLINNPELCSYLGRSARQRAEKLFGWDSIAHKHSEHYSRFLTSTSTVYSKEAISA